MEHPGESPTPEQLFGAMVRSRRDARGWTQEELRKRLAERGVHLEKTAMIRLEGGKRATRFNEVVALAQVLDLDLRTSTFAPSVEEQIKDAVRVARKHLEAAERKMVVVTDELARVDMQRARWAKQLADLHQIAAVLNEILRTLTTGEQDDSAALKELDEMFANSAIGEFLAVDDG